MRVGAKLFVEQRMMIGNPRFEFLFVAGFAKPSRVRELQADKQSVERARLLDVGFLQFFEQRR